MKYHLIALAASSIFGSAVARAGHQHHRRHDHPVAEECVAPMTPVPCQTITRSYLVEVEKPNHTGGAPPPPPVQLHDAPTTTIVSHPEVTEPPHADVEPEVTTCDPGTYTFGPKTVTITQTEYLCVPKTKKLPPGVHTIGGVTTIVDRQTTVVCPVPDVQTVEDKTISKVKITTFVCPEAGTYTIGPITTTITETADCEYPEVTEYPPGVYTQPETVVTITETQVVVTCPYFETKTEEVTVVPVPNTDAPAPTTTSEPPKVPDTPPKEEEPEKEEPETDSPQVPPHSGPLWGITYSPFVKNNGAISCKDAALVDSQLADIAAKGFKSIRLYSPECDGLTMIAPAAKKHGLKLVLGIFIKSGACRADDELNQILNWKKWDQVDLFVVANESIFQGYCSGESLAAYIRESKTKLRNAGYNGPVTTTEPLNILQANSVLCDAVDVNGINIHPYFNPNVASSDAGSFVNGQIAEAKKVCPNKEVYVLEAGWPNSGNVNGKAVPTPEQQRVAFNSIRNTCPMDRIIVFTYENDYWKDPGAFGVEQNFGAREVF